MDDSNVGRPAILRSNCGDGGSGSEVVYVVQPRADGRACFTVVSADYDVVLYLKDECATNPAVFSSGFLECEDTAGLEPPTG